LETLGLTVEVFAPPDQEGGLSYLPPMHAVMALAARKAMAAFPLREETIVIAADTMVVLDNEVLGKPQSLMEAREFLRRLSGQWHFVYTGVAIGGVTFLELFYEETAVRFHKVSEPLIEAYLATGSSLDKAGGYGAQDLIGVSGIAEIRGDFYNVMGLPVQRLCRVWENLFGLLPPAHLG